MANVLDSITNALATGTSAASDLKQDIKDAKDAAVAAYAVSTTLQLISTVAACVIAYTAWQTYKRKG